MVQAWGDVVRVGETEVCPTGLSNESSSWDTNAVGKFLVAVWLMTLGGGSGEGGGENRSQREGRGGREAGRSYGR